MVLDEPREGMAMRSQLVKVLVASLIMAGMIYGSLSLSSAKPKRDGEGTGGMTGGMTGMG
jgi:hypothetical protein